MKLGPFAAVMLLAGCASSYPHRYPSVPNEDRRTNVESRSTDTFRHDVTECERKAALSGAGAKAEAFNNCMRARGHTR